MKQRKYYDVTINRKSLVYESGAFFYQLHQKILSKKDFFRTRFLLQIKSHDLYKEDRQSIIVHNLTPRTTRYFHPIEKFATLKKFSAEDSLQLWWSGAHPLNNDRLNIKFSLVDCDQSSI